MSLNIAIQMDLIEEIDIDADSSFVMALEAQERGYNIHHYLPKNMVLQGERLYAKTHPLKVKREKGRHFELGPEETRDLDSFDIILMRQDPPFDMAYITATHWLERISHKTLVVNDPAEVRNAPEKIFVLNFGDLMPPTLITSDHHEICQFRKEQGDIVVKPLYGHAGNQVFHITERDENMNALLEIFTGLYREPIIIQKYLPEIRQGDKRIILIDGKIGGAVMRVPVEGEARANFHAGGQPQKTELNARELEICERIGPELSRRGLIFAGIDIIGDYLIEINITSPTGIQEINALEGCRLEADLWDAIEKRYSDFKNEQENKVTAL